jgi:hypothetical protein
LSLLFDDDEVFKENFSEIFRKGSLLLQIYDRFGSQNLGCLDMYNERLGFDNIGIDHNTAVLAAYDVTAFEPEFVERPSNQSSLNTSLSLLFALK